jgi:ATP-dependent DNA ligase
MIIPMNAKSAGSKLEKLMDDPRYIAEVKIDGYRAICDNGRFYSRLGNEFTEKIPQLHDALKEHNIVLDGELYIPGGTSNDITTALGSKGDRSKLRYIVFDVLEIGYAVLIGLTWAQRRETLERWFCAVEGIEGVTLSQVYINKHSILEYAESNGLEGIMLKNIDALYYPDKRPENTWYKVKKSMTYDVVVMGYTEGKGKYEGLIGAVEFGLYKKGVLTPCGQCSGFDNEMRRNITGSKEFYMHRVFEISAMERTSDGHFRHPVFKQWRSDKAPMQCLWKQ